MAEDAISGVEIAPCLPALAVAHLPLCLWLGEGPLHSRMAFLWHWLNPLFCEWARLHLRLELFMGKFSLSLFFFPLWLSHSLGCCHISSLRLFPGHSGPVLTLSNAACASLFSPRLLVVDMSVCATSLRGVAVRRVIYGFYLFFSSQL